jgi:hypothetical protein
VELNMPLKLLAELLELAVQGPDHLDQCPNTGAIGLGDHAGRLQLRGAQHGLELGCASFHAALATGPAQRRGQPGPRPPPTKVGVGATCSTARASRPPRSPPKAARAPG